MTQSKSCGMTSDSESEEDTDFNEPGFCQNSNAFNGVAIVPNCNPGVDQHEVDSPSPNAPLHKLLLVSLSMFGISFCWGCQFARASATFEALGLPEDALGLIWLAGPISGAVVSPLVGLASDRIGARKPFMLLGLVGIVLGFSGFAFVVDIGELLGDHPDEGIFSNALRFAIAMFWISDISINVIQAPLRTLLVDVAPPSQQPLANGMLSVMQGLGNLLVFSIGGMRIGKQFAFLKGDLPTSFLLDVRTLYCLGVVCAVVCVGCTLCFVGEGIHQPAAPEEIPQHEESFWQRCWQHLPPGLSGICILQIFVWFNWFSYLVYIVPFVAVEVFHGSPDVKSAAAFDQGVQWANLGLAINSIVTLVCSLVFPKLVEGNQARIYRVYLCCLIVQLILMGLLTVVQTPMECLVIIAALGFPWAGSLVLPYSIAGEACAQVENKGLYMSFLNISICLPQILVSVTSMGILELFHGNFRYVIGLSVITQFIACLLLLPLQAQQTQNKEPISKEVISLIPEDETHSN